MRADARRNRRRLVRAAIDLHVQQGPEVPLEAIARTADVGIGTLYRHFPDRQALVRAVALEAFAAVRELADDVVGEQDPDLLATYLHGVAELRVAVLMATLQPALVELAGDPELQAAFEDVLEANRRLVDAAQARGQLRGDVTIDDLLPLLAQLTRPLDGVSGEHLEAVTPRLLHLAVEGLRPRADQTPMPNDPPSDPLP